MRHYDYPEVNIFKAYTSEPGLNHNVHVTIGPTDATVITTVFKFDPETENDEEHEQVITLSRYAIIGMAHEICNKKSDRFRERDNNGHDYVEIRFTEDKAQLRTVRWDNRDKPGVSQLVELTRHTAIGLFYEILRETGSVDG